VGLARITNLLKNIVCYHLSAHVKMPKECSAYGCYRPNYETSPARSHGIMFVMLDFNIIIIIVVVIIIIIKYLGPRSKLKKIWHGFLL
jgi:hypothetical protein